MVSRADAVEIAEALTSLCERAVELLWCNALIRHLADGRPCTFWGIFTLCEVAMSGYPASADGRHRSVRQTTPRQAI